MCNHLALLITICCLLSTNIASNSTSVVDFYIGLQLQCVPFASLSQCIPADSSCRIPCTEYGIDHVLCLTASSNWMSFGAGGDPTSAMLAGMHHPHHSMDFVGVQQQQQQHALGPAAGMTAGAGGGYHHYNGIGGPLGASTAGIDAGSSSSTMTAAAAAAAGLMMNDMYQMDPSAFMDPTGAMQQMLQVCMYGA